MLQEIRLATTEPESEWVRGRSVRKVSPGFDHARVQAVLTSLLIPWSRGRGSVGTEWRFRVRPPGEIRRPLVPDIAFVASERLRGLTHAERQAPALSPDVAFEILSPGDVPADVASKVAVYLRSGSELVVIVDPATRSVELFDDSASDVRLGPGETLAHPALPDLAISLASLFREALDLET